MSIESMGLVPGSQLIDHLIRTAPLSICVFLIAVVGVPVYFATGYEAPFEALCFVLFWLLSVQFQRSLKSSTCLLRFPRPRSMLVIFANPVVITWALGTAYLWIKTTCTNQTIDITISEFRRHETLAECIIAMVKGDGLRESIGAGDMAGPILDAGIVCMGFKMFEYRKELWESIVTVFTTCAILAVENVFLNVLFARAFGLQTSDAVSFAARSVTIALGVPAIQNIKGSTTLMSAMVIFGGIIFQMAGDCLFSLLRIKDRKCQQKLDSGRNSNSEKSGVMDVGHGKEPQQGVGADTGVISAGVTVGINAAAMGTAHLMERNSEATAYSALSMTVFGAITVALTALPGVSEAIISLASR
ncbi:LrgB-like family-domain-containing protein [Hypomontagnella submonticulosa]|nr:LrgB-like family-domain-containing protein [Hypomontagnella submonticulosa]